MPDKLLGWRFFVNIFCAAYRFSDLASRDRCYIANSFLCFLKHTLYKIYNFTVIKTKNILHLSHPPEKTTEDLKV